MNSLAAFIRLARMRRSAGATPVQAACWAAGLLWRDHQITRRRRHLERRAEIEHTARHRL